jgi:hypothetical protein
MSHIKWKHKFNYHDEYEDYIGLENAGEEEVTYEVSNSTDTIVITDKNGNEIFRGGEDYAIEVAKGLLKYYMED